MRIISNTKWFNNGTINGCKMEFFQYNFNNKFDLIKAILKSFNCDCVFLNIASRHLYYFCLIKWILPFGNYKLISLDIVLSKPLTIKEKIIVKIKMFMLKKVDFFLLYIKDFSFYKEYYGIRLDKLVYIPFKVNSYSEVIRKETCDDGYILTGGVSKRDYKTFFNALKNLRYKTIAVVPQNQECIKHGAFVDYSDIPENVTIVHDDGSTASWIEYFSKAKFVVLPIIADTMSPSGISTYLLAMALKKCVIMTVGPATKCLLNDKNAVLVPPEDAYSLREAIIKTYEDDNYRNKIAEAGYKYAISLKGHDRLVEDILHFLTKLQN